MALTNKQRLFVAEYLKDQNATQAYVRSYKVKESTARTNGPRMLENAGVKKEIQKKMNKKIERIDVSKDRIIKEIAYLAFSHLGLVCIQDEDTGNLKLKSIGAMDAGALATLESIQENKMHNKDGDIVSTHTKFRMHDKIKALEMLCKHLGLLGGQGVGATDNESFKERALEHITEHLSKRSKSSK